MPSKPIPPLAPEGQTPPGSGAALAAQPLLRLEGIVKCFPGVRALDGVDFDLLPGEVHVLFGENGAGKSTIINVIAGTFGADEGRYTFDGQAVTSLTPIKARRLGIQPVFQEFSLVGELSVEQNLALGREPGRLGVLDRRAMRERAQAAIARLGFHLKPDVLVADLSRAQQQMVEIAKAMMTDVRVLILDEPTASLTDTEAERLFALVDELKAQGVAIIYVSHRMREIRRLADRITVLRDGRHIATVNRHEVTDDHLIELMTGRQIGILFPDIPASPGEVALEVENLALASGGVKRASIQARTGEIVGIAGLAGCGKSDLVRALYGIGEIVQGQVRYHGKPLRVRHPIDALEQGICYFPSDRAREGLALTRPIRENASMAALRRPEFSHRGLLRLASEKSVVTRIMQQLKLRPPDIERQVGNLSGGNRQKVLLARGLSRPVEVFMFDEPTVGIDVGAKLEVYDMMRSLVEAGKSIILVSSELPEVMGLSHRLYVMHDGEVTAHFERKDYSEAAILAHFFPKQEAAPAMQEASS